MRVLVAVFVFSIATVAVAEATRLAPVELDRSPEARRRGAQVVVNVCMNCHSLHHLRYRDLPRLGFSADELTALQAGHAPEEPMLSVMDDATAIASFGRLPPDQSLLAKAREGGAQYIYSIVISYEKDKDGNVVNTIMPEIKMPDVLGHADTLGPEREAVQRDARDAAVFLEWASDPRADERKFLGRYVIGYLIVLTVLLYFVKRRVWRRLPPRAENP